MTLFKPATAHSSAIVRPQVQTYCSSPEAETPCYEYTPSNAPRQTFEVAEGWRTRDYARSVSRPHNQRKKNCATGTYECEKPSSWS